MQVVDNTEMRHFEMREGEQLAIIEYQIQEKKIFLTRVDFPESFLKENKHYEMIGQMLDLIETSGRRVVPMTRVIKEYFRSHPARKNLLPVGIHI